MPRVRQKADDYLRRDIAAAIVVAGAKAGLTNAKDIARETGIPYGTLLNRMKHPTDFTIEEIRLLIRRLPLTDELAALVFGGAR